MPTTSGRQNEILQLEVRCFLRYRLILSSLAWRQVHLYTTSISASPLSRWARAFSSCPVDTVIERSWRDRRIIITPVMIMRSLFNGEYSSRINRWIIRSAVFKSTSDQPNSRHPMLDPFDRVQPRRVPPGHAGYSRSSGLTLLRRIYITLRAPLHRQPHVGRVIEKRYINFQSPRAIAPALFLSLEDRTACYTGRLTARTSVSIRTECIAIVEARFEWNYTKSEFYLYFQRKPRYSFIIDNNDDIH